MQADPAYLARSSKASISIVAAVAGLNGDSLVGGPWLVLPLDHPLVDVMCAMRIGHKMCANADRYLLGHGVV